MEEWRDIPGYPGYQASDLGRVRSVDRQVIAKASSKLAHVRAYKGKILKPGTMNDFGHQSVMMGRAGGSQCVHVLVLLAFTGPRPEGCEGRHWNTDATDNRWGNLVWGTRAENNRDASREGKRRVTLAQAAEIRERSSREPLSLLAEEFGMCESNARYIANGTYYVEEL